MTRFSVSNPSRRLKKKLKQATAGVAKAGRKLDHEIREKPQELASDGRATLRGAATAARAVADAIKTSAAYQWLVERFAVTLMDRPRLTRVGSFRGRSRVVFVNGILTTEDEALEDADRLATHLQRPVDLLYNPSVIAGQASHPGASDDLAESIYDRTWPATLGSGVNPLSILTPAILISGPPFTQLNKTTRQLTHLTYHASEPVHLVGHSQGCLIARNALFTTALFRGEKRVRRGVRWVGTGCPLNRAEIWPTSTASPHLLVNRGDPVAQIVGFNFGDHWLESARLQLKTHKFHTQYLPKIQDDWLAVEQDAPASP